MAFGDRFLNWITTRKRAHRQASVRIKNSTGQKILSVTVGHKYSESYIKDKTWEGPIGIDSTTPVEADMTVDYITGFGTTGRDWWIVSWVTEDGKVHTSDPKNAREFLENVHLYIAALAVPITLGTSSLIFGAAAITGVVVGESVRNGSTAGFKRHTLRAEDQGQLTTIILKEEEVTFHSPSGISNTGTSTTELPPMQPFSDSNLLGKYECHLYDKDGKNDWHYVTISNINDTSLKWENQAGVSWTLTSTSNRNILSVSEDCPYFKDGHTQVTVKWGRGYRTLGTSIIESWPTNSVGGLLGPGNELYLKSSPSVDTASLSAEAAPLSVETISLSVETVPLYMGWSDQRLDSRLQVGNNFESMYRQYGDVRAHVFVQKQPDVEMVPLYVGWSNARLDTRLQVGNKFESMYQQQGDITGWIYKDPQDGMLPLVRGWSNKRQDTRTQVGEKMEDMYQYRKILGYVPSY